MHRTAKHAVVAVVAALAFPALAQTARAEEKKPALGRDDLIAGARELIATQKYCALITLDETGAPSVRTMNPFPPEEDMTVWIATNDRSRKVREIRRDPRVTLYYSDHSQAIGYVAIAGRAALVDDMKEIVKRKRAYWDTAFPDLKHLVLIKVVPERLEVIYYKKNIVNDPETWRAPFVEFPAPPAAK